MNYYSKNAGSLYEQYQSLDPDKVHAAWKHLLPEQPGLACDVGAGSGRDANWLAEQGWDVVAVEPCDELREMAQHNSHPRVTWINDTLPELKKLRDLGQRYNLILISAVWMHLSEKERGRAFRIVSELLAPNGLLVITLKHEASEEAMRERGFHACQPEELQQLAQARALANVETAPSEDQLGREGVKWDTLCFKLPDDGTGSLPLLRHIIVNDDKAASYKLGLLRTLIRTAEGAPGMLLDRTDKDVAIPFGVLGLYWLKLYMPLLLRYEIRQQARADSGYLFAKDDFYALKDISSFDLRVGAQFSGDRAKIVTGAIRAACYNIKKNPGHFTTFPGTNRQVFRCEYETVRGGTHAIQIEKEYLSRFGKVWIPVEVWRTLGTYACWLEPAIINEWVNLMAGWEVRYSSDVYYKALAW